MENMTMEVVVAPGISAHQLQQPWVVVSYENQARDIDFRPSIHEATLHGGVI
jgi:hypothetical protein